MILNESGVNQIYKDVKRKSKSYRKRMELQILVENQVSPQAKNLKKVIATVKRFKRVGIKSLCDVSGLSITLVNRCLNVLEFDKLLSREYKKGDGRQDKVTIVFN